MVGLEGMYPLGLEVSMVREEDGLAMTGERGGWAMMSPALLFLRCRLNFGSRQPDVPLGEANSGVVIDRELGIEGSGEEE